jgi:hypothetical protein
MAVVELVDIRLHSAVTDLDHLRFKGLHAVEHTEHVGVPLHLDFLCELHCQMLEHLVTLLSDALHQLIHSLVTHLVILCCGLELGLVPLKLLLRRDTRGLPRRLLQVSNFDPVVIIEQPGVVPLFLEG